MCAPLIVLELHIPLLLSCPNQGNLQIALNIFIKCSLSATLSPKELKVLCYDRGQTIPKTLPFSGIQERVMASLKNLGLSKIDADLIHAALVTKRTMTGELHRGKGIPELKSFIDKHGAGHLSIYSRNGIVHYEKRRNKLPEIRKKRIAKPILGTLIEWCIILD